MQTFQERMLNENWQEEIRPYMDPHFGDPENLLQLALCMARAGMLRAVKSQKGTVTMLMVVKKAAWEGEELKISLRLIFDERRNNVGWKAPPWFGLGGVASLSQIDVSEEITSRDYCLRYATGDVPNSYWALGLPEEIAPHFCFRNICFADRRRCWNEESLPLEGEGDYVALSVPAMGFSSAVFLAQTTMEDIFDGQGIGESLGLSKTRRIAEGAPVPNTSGADTVAHYEHIDDVGIIGLGPSHVKEG